jgi:hypothetical protein
MQKFQKASFSFYFQCPHLGGEEEECNSFFGPGLGNVSQTLHPILIAYDIHITLLICQYDFIIQIYVSIYINGP